MFKIQFVIGVAGDHAKITIKTIINTIVADIGIDCTCSWYTIKFNCCYCYCCSWANALTISLWVYLIINYYVFLSFKVSKNFEWFDPMSNTIKKQSNATHLWAVENLNAGNVLDQVMIIRWIRCCGYCYPYFPCILLLLVFVQISNKIQILTQQINEINVQ